MLNKIESGGENAFILTNMQEEINICFIEDSICAILFDLLPVVFHFLFTKQSSLCKGF